MAKKPSKQPCPTSDGASGNVEHGRCSQNNNRESRCGSQNNGRLSVRFSADSTLSDSGHGHLSPYATPSATREVLERHGLYTKYALGQNFLVNDDIVRKIIELADVQPTDHVLEVGPGIGTLTSALLQKAGHVTSIEMDHDLPTVLQDTLAPWLGCFTLLEMDALDLREEHLQRAMGVACDDGSASKGTVPKDDWEDSHLSQNDCLQSSMGAVPSDSFPLPNKLVSNLPYAVAATIVLDYLQRFPFLQSATVMVQKEVADRMQAEAGTKDYGSLSLAVQYYSHPHVEVEVPPRSFMPRPKVSSSVISLDIYETPPVKVEDEELFRNIVRAAFSQRRKTLVNALGNAALLSFSKEQVAAALKDLGLPETIRGEVLSLEQFAALANRLGQETGR